MFWSKRVKVNHDGISMTAGSVIVEADNEVSAHEEIRKLSSGWPDDTYCPPFAPLKGPFSTREEAEKS